jgi:hypothetical protein
VALAAVRVWILASPGSAIRWASVRSGRTGSPARSYETRVGAALCHAVAGIGNRRPFNASCLEQGMALVLLLFIVRIPAHLVVGVSRQGGPEPLLRAHAWVESRGNVLIGGVQAPEFVSILPASGSTASSCPG